MKKSKHLFAEVENLSPSRAEHGSGRPARSREISRREMAEVAADYRPGDGVDPRDEARRRRREQGDARPGFAHGVHKQEQFLSQVESALEAALLSAASPVLNALTVRDVAKQGGSLVVVVSPRHADEPLDIVEANAALMSASSMLSREVASAITRKETPTLSFVVLPATAEKVGE